jgi:hypothetical protein
MIKVNQYVILKYMDHFLVEVMIFVFKIIVTKIIIILISLIHMEKMKELNKMSLQKLINLQSRGTRYSN